MILIEHGSVAETSRSSQGTNFSLNCKPTEKFEYVFLQTQFLFQFVSMRAN